MKPEVALQILDEVDYEFEREGPPDWYPDVPRIPAARYSDPDFFELEQQALRKCWFTVGTVHELPEVGSYKLVDRWNGAAIFVVRGEDNEIRAFWNACTHRGGPVVKGENGHCGVEQRFRCAIHSWTYGLDGKLVGVPGRRDFHENLDRNVAGLPEVRCEVWRGFIFVNRDPNAPELVDWLGPIADEATWFDGLRSAGSSSFVLNCNWKLAIEANIEVYHVTTVHPDTVALSLDYRGSAEELYQRGHSRMIVPAMNYDSQQTRAAAEDDPLRALMSNTNVSYLLFPNHLTPGGARADGRYSLTLQSFWPLSPNQTLSEWHIMVPDWGPGEPSAKLAASVDGYSTIMHEDTAYLEQVQKAIESGATEGLLTSYHERRVYHHEASIDRLIGIDNVPEQLRVKQILPIADAPPTPDALPTADAD
jgi:phenylpropionate dioxygenase-like ring-hydroxylating dioxygenase large terminal subunit